MGAAAGRGEAEERVSAGPAGDRGQPRPRRDLGPDGRLRDDEPQRPRLHEPLPLRQAGRLHGARVLRRRRHRHGPLLGPAGDRRRTPRSAIPPRGCGALPRPPCGPPGSGSSGRSGCCSPETRCPAARRSSGGSPIEAPPAEQLRERTEVLLERIARVPVNQLMMMKLLVNQSPLCPGPARHPGAGHGLRRDHTPHGRGLRLSAAGRREGFREAVRERGTSPSGTPDARPSRGSCAFERIGRGASRGQPIRSNDFARRSGPWTPPHGDG